MFSLSALVLAAHVSVDVTANRHLISEGIYGVTFASDAQLTRLGLSLRRFGGNAYSRYNFQAQTTNEGGDNVWFRNRVLSDGGPDFADNFLDVTRDAGLDVMLELPLLGFVAKPGSATSPPWTCGFSVAKYGAQRTTAPDDANCGDGFKPDGGRLTGNDPLDTSIAIDAGFLASWVQHVSGRARYYDLGNQPALWNSTHYDIHPDPSSYAEISAKLSESSAVVKANDPQAKTLGPSEWGWLNYFDSAAGDRMSAGIDFVPFYLREAQLLEVARGVRQLDYLDLHVYPQAASPNTGAIINGDTTAATNALRLRSTAILWDPNYVVESWESCCFDNVLRIIPRMRDWIATQYPGTGVSFSSYGWGAYNHITGALAQADVLGIFAREAVDLATLDAPPFDGQRIEDAFLLYRNYDNAGARFGQTSVSATSDDLSNVTTYAAFTGQTVTVVLINKNPALSQQADVVLPGVSTGTWRVFGFSNISRLNALNTGTLSTAGGTITLVLPPYSAQVLELVADQPLPTMSPDAGTPDAGTIDAGMMDAGSPDSGEPDAGMMDAGQPDSGTPDSGAPDAGPADSGTPDSGLADAGPRDAGSPDGGNMMMNPSSCGCHASAAPLFSLALLSLLRRRRR
jgi:hypothetical protein